MAKPLIDVGSTSRLGKRQIEVETCDKYRYTLSVYDDPKDFNHHGQSCQVANYVRDGQIVAQKCRFADKTFTWRGDTKRTGLYGQHLWRSGGRKLVITEGEIDCLTVSQLQGLKWPVVSIPNGSDGALRAITAELEWVESFAEIILMFDMDDAGQKAAQEVAQALTGTTVKIAHLPHKDPNECLTEGDGKAVITAMWEAKEYRPDSIVTVADVIEDALKPVAWGFSYPYDELTLLTYGRRFGECVALGAGTGVGKTEVIAEFIEHDIYVHGFKVGLLAFEQRPGETANRIAGKHAGKRFHVPNTAMPEHLKAAADRLKSSGFSLPVESWTDAERTAGLRELEAQDKLVMYDNWGAITPDTVLARIRYMVQHQGCKVIYLDHLTALAAHADDEKKCLEQVMADIATLAESLNFWLGFVSHLTTPDGTPHEEGGRVTIRHFKGSRAIGFWSHFMFGLERNQQHDDPDVKSTTIFRVLKDRYTGQAAGHKFGLRFDPGGNRLVPAPIPDEDGGQHGFTAQKQTEPTPDNSEY